MDLSNYLGDSTQVPEVLDVEWFRPLVPQTGIILEISDAGAEKYKIPEICVNNQYSTEEKQILKDLCDVVMKTPWTMQDFIRRHYLRSQLEGTAVTHWLRPESFLLLIDTAWYNSCEEARSKITGHPFNPSFVIKTAKCPGCNHRYAEKCSTLGCRIYNGKIDSGAVINHIIELRSRHCIDQSTYNQCVGMCENQPLDALRLALIPTQNVINDESQDLIALYKDSEMVVEAPPPSIFEPLNLGDVDPRAGMDDYLTNP
jgi:hypothetical protein